MSFDTCIATLREEGKIDAARAARFAALYDEMERRFVAQHGATTGAVLAGEETLRALDWDAALRRRQGALQIEAQRTGFADMERYDKGSGTRDGAAVTAMIARDMSGRAPFVSVEGRMEQLDFESHRMLAEFIERHRRNMAGQVRDKAGLLDIVRERHGQASGNADAKALSDAIGEVFEAKRQQFNLLGGDIGYDAKYGMSHRWDARKVRAVPFAEFRDAVLPELDLARMADPLTGQRFSEDGLQAALSAVYETIRTDGLAGLGSGEAGGGRKLANRRSDARFLQFIDGDAWLRVNERFGSADPFSAIVDHVHGMNRDIAMMERFGPNPDATVAWLSDQAARRIAQGSDPSPHALNAAQALPKQVDKIWRQINGDANIPVMGGPIHSTSIKILQGSRDLLTAAKLGKAALTTLGDLATIHTASKFNGLPQTSMMLGYLRELNPFSAADRKLAVQLELGMRDATQSMFGLNRFFGQSHSPAMTKVIADTSLRITGLNAITEAGQRHFGKSFLGYLALERAKPIEALEPGLRATLERYGIDAAQWDAMRAAPVHAERGGEWMSGRLVRESAPAAADRMMDMVLTETSAAVQMSHARGQAMTNFGAPGTLGGEAGKSLLQFKSFTASLMLTQGHRITAMGALSLGAPYFARLFIGLTVFGAMTLQLRQLTYGQDLRPMDNREFWIDAMLQGGGVGIFGDVIGSFQREGKSGLAGVVGGPLVGAASDIGKATIGNAFRAARGDQTHTLRDLNEFARRNTPGSNTWYASLAFQRMIFDQMRALADPNYAQSWSRMESRAAQQGTGYFWAPGETAPARAPDFSNIAGSAGKPPAGEPGSMVQ